MHEANRHPRMGDLYRRYFDHCAEIGGGTWWSESAARRTLQKDGRDGRPGKGGSLDVHHRALP
jgi:hypothetical protein